MLKSAKKNENSKDEYDGILSKHTCKGTRLMALDQNRRIIGIKDKVAAEYNEFKIEWKEMVKNIRHHT
jgi:hypothetical protein